MICFVLSYLGIGNLYGNKLNNDSCIVHRINEILEH